MQAVILISEVDYSDVLSKLENPAGRNAAAVLKIFSQNKKDEFAVYFVKMFKKQILESMNSLLEKKQLLLKIIEITAMKNGNIEICLTFDEIDYKALISTVYPQVIARFGSNEKFSKIFSVFDKLGDKSDDIIQAILDVLSQDEKDEIVSYIVSQYEQDIILFVNKLAAKENIKVSISGIEMRKI